jgi:UDP-N-acetylmuramate: L-alanyl-gamma-D-glutamyl-meso-diaminopimelate ligase
VYRDMDKLLSSLIREVRPADYVLIMSNGGFGGLHEKLLEGLEAQVKNG